MKILIVEDDTLLLQGLILAARLSRHRRNKALRPVITAWWYWI